MMKNYNYKSLCFHCIIQMENFQSGHFGINYPQNKNIYLIKYTGLFMKSIEKPATTYSSILE